MTDYVDRLALRNALYEADAITMGGVKILNQFPAADVRPVVPGRWIDRDNDYYGWNLWACSACGEEFELTEGTPDMNGYHFCPNCGADMRTEG